MDLPAGTEGVLISVYSRGVNSSEAPVVPFEDTRPRSVLSSGQEMKMYLPAGTEGVLISVYS